MDKIKVIVMNNDGMKVKDIENSLTSFQNIVDGDIELAPLTEDMAVIYNKEGKVLELPPTFAVEYKHYPTSVLAGNIIFVGIKSINELVKISLSSEQINNIQNELFNDKEYIENIGDFIPAIWCD